MPSRIEDELNPIRVGVNRYRIADGRIMSRQAVHNIRKGYTSRKRFNMTSGIGYTVRILQEITGTSIGELAEKTGLHRQTITQLRRNTSDNPRLSTVTLLAIAFDMDVPTFITFTEKATQLYLDETGKESL